MSAVGPTSAWMLKPVVVMLVRSMLGVLGILPDAPSSENTGVYRALGTAPPKVTVHVVAPDAHAAIPFRIWATRAILVSFPAMAMLAVVPEDELSPTIPQVVVLAAGSASTAPMRWEP